MSKYFLISGAVVILVGAGSFWGGIKYQQAKTASQFTRLGNNERMLFNANGQFRSGAVGQNRQNFRPINGQITSIDEKSITVKMADGSSRIVLLTNSTLLSKFSEANKEDLKVGETVMAIGSENADGSISAQNIQINPPQRGQQTNRVAPNSNQ